MDSLKYSSIEEAREGTVNEIIDLWEKHDRVLCVRYTNFGKTYFIARNLILKYSNKRFLVVANNKRIKETYSSIFNMQNVTVITYQWLIRQKYDMLYKHFGNIDYIIFDECHHLGAKLWGNFAEILSRINNHVKVLGLTATDERLDKVDILNTFFDGVQTTRLELLDGMLIGHIPDIKYVVAYCDVTEELNDLRVKDVDRHRIEDLMNIPNILYKHIPKERLDNVFKLYVFIPRIDYFDSAIQCCRDWFKSAYPDKHINIYTMGSNYSQNHNKTQLELFKSDTDRNNIDIIISVDMLNEAARTEFANTAIFLRKTVSKSTYYQQMGRPIIGTTQPLIFDFVENCKNITKTKQFITHSGNKCTDREKKMFFSRINLVDETRDIRDILDTYRYGHKTITTILNNIDYVNENIYKISTSDMARYLKLNRSDMIRALEKLNLYKTEDNPFVNKAKINLELAIKIQNCLDRYMSTPDIVKELDISVNTYHRCYRKYDLQRKQIKDADEFIKDNYKVRSWDEIRSALHITEDGLYSRIKTLNLDYKSYPIIEDYIEGLGIDRIARKYGFSKDFVTFALEQMGISRRIRTASNKFTLKRIKEISDYYNIYGYTATLNNFDVNKHDIYGIAQYGRVIDEFKLEV